MTFGQAISSGFANITNFEGRASRPAFWWWVLLIFIINAVNGLIFGRGSGFIMFLAYVIYLILWLATIAVGCRRLHDTGKSGWLQLLGIIPCVGIIILIVFWVQPGNPSANAYGPPPAA
jgi:uncharacterized membrane protein YhaH (DUF805 family)